MNGHRPERRKAEVRHEEFLYTLAWLFVRELTRLAVFPLFAFMDPNLPSRLPDADPRVQRPTPCG